MAPAPARPQPIQHLVFKRFAGSVCVRDLEEVDFVPWHAAREVLQGSVEGLFERAGAEVVLQAGFGGWVGPFGSCRLERVQAEADVGAVDGFDDFPYVFPGGRVAGPAPVFVGEAFVLFGEHVG